ncbi:MAG TPA: hydrogenase maturation protease [Terriglobia bacterium]|nr:hydrogenase maturation protease [Terriglobia bacterium]
MILVAGIGNIFFGDDAFGSEVARRLWSRDLPEGVRVVDFGIRGIDLVYALLDGHDTVIIVDAAPRGGPPGTLYVIEPDLNQVEPTGLEAHSMDLMRVLALARNMGAELHRVRIVGCEPESLGSQEEGRMGLSPPVNAALDEAIGIIESLIQEALVRT